MHWKSNRVVVVVIDVVVVVVNVSIISGCVSGSPAENVHTAGGACLLALKPGAKTMDVKYVVAWQLLASSIAKHILATDDAHVIGVLNILAGGIGIEGVHVANSSPRHDHIIQRLLEASVP